MFHSSVLFVVTLPLVVGFPHMASTVFHEIESANLPATDFKRKHTPSGGLTEKHFNWKAPGEGDVRAPCPVMNTLANHDFVPHNGRNVTMPVFVQACLDAFNISAAFCIDAFGTGVAASNPVPNATFFDLDMLHNTHGVIEHDGSLSRRDAVFDPSNRFDEGTFNNLVSYFDKSTAIDIPTMANARARHALDMSLINPGFNITEAAVPVILGENAMMMAIWGHPERPIANKAFYEYFFRNERIPVELGWKPSDVEIDITIGSIVQELIERSPSGVPLTFDPSNKTVL